VVGYFNYFPGHGFLRNANGSFETFDFAVEGINDGGVIVGAGPGPDDNSVGMIRIGDTNYSYTYPGASTTFLDGINNHNQVIGFYIDRNNSEGIFEGQLSFVTTPSPRLYRFVPFS